jgi:hypothetical protein
MQLMMVCKILVSMLPLDCAVVVVQLATEILFRWDSICDLSYPKMQVPGKSSAKMLFIHFPRVGAFFLLHVAMQPTILFFMLYLAFHSFQNRAEEYTESTPVE